MKANLGKQKVMISGSKEEIPSSKINPCAKWDRWMMENLI